MVSKDEGICQHEDGFNSRGDIIILGQSGQFDREGETLESKLPSSCVFSFTLHSAIMSAIHRLLVVGGNGYLGMSINPLVYSKLTDTPQAQRYVAQP